MSKRLLLINVLLGAVALLFLAYVVRVLSAPAAELRPARARSGAPLGPLAPPPPMPPGAYAIVASRNLFSPTRSEAPGLGTGAASGMPALPKPNLYGVVLRDRAPVAYLEDPVTKRVAGYRVGDSIAGGTVKSISADRVELMRPEGVVEVQLHDPVRPRAPLGPMPGQPGASPGVVPGVPPPASSLPGVIPPTSASPAPPVAGQADPQLPFGRRQFRPNLPSLPPGNAPTQ